MFSAKVRIDSLARSTPCISNSPRSRAAWLGGGSVRLVVIEVVVAPSAGIRVSLAIHDGHVRNPGGAQADALVDAFKARIPSFPATSRDVVIASLLFKVYQQELRRCHIECVLQRGREPLCPAQADRIVGTALYLAQVART